MVDVKNLEFSYPGVREKTLKGLNFTIGAGEIFGFLGPSGAGKSTTQKILIGLLKGYSGQVRVMGRELSDGGRDYYERIGVAFEQPNLYSKFTALENLAFFRSLFTGKTREPADLLALVGLEQDARRRIAVYSKGMRVRLNFCRALLNEPQVLFLDEPTAGLDPVNARNIKDIILGQKAMGRTVFLTTHNMTVAAETCDRVAFITEGGIVMLEKEQGILASLFVTPLSVTAYFIAKSVSLTLIALLASFVLAFAGVGDDFNPAWLFVGVTLTSLLFIQVGLALSSRFRSLNEYMFLGRSSVGVTFLPLFSYFWPRAKPFLVCSAFSSVASAHRSRVPPRPGLEVGLRLRLSVALRSVGPSVGQALVLAAPRSANRGGAMRRMLALYGGDVRNILRDPMNLMVALVACRSGFAHTARPAQAKGCGSALSGSCRTLSLHHEFYRNVCAAHEWLGGGVPAPRWTGRGYTHVHLRDSSYESRLPAVQDRRPHRHQFSADICRFGGGGPDGIPSGYNDSHRPDGVVSGRRLQATSFPRSGSCWPACCRPTGYPGLSWPATTADGQERRPLSRKQ